MEKHPREQKNCCDCSNADQGAPTRDLFSPSPDNSRARNSYLRKKPEEVRGPCQFPAGLRIRPEDKQHYLPALTAGKPQGWERTWIPMPWGFQIERWRSARWIRPRSYSYPRLLRHSILPPSQTQLARAGPQLDLSKRFLRPLQR